MVYINTDSPLIPDTHLNNGSAAIHFEGDDLDMTAHYDSEPICQHCSETVAEYADGWGHDHNDSRYCDEDADPANLDEDYMAEVADEFTDPNTCEIDWDAYESEHNTASPAPSAPGNWVGFTINPDRGEVQAQISLGDPRGCMTFTVRRGTDENGDEALYLHVPYEGEGLAHVTLTHIHDGTYRIG